jgi:hypothetical protein
MRIVSGFFVPAVLAVCLTACATTTPVPGAENVRITKNLSDVASCTAVGNIRVPVNPSTGTVDIANAATQFRNQTIGLGGNTGFVTNGVAGVPAEGVAYRCP